MFVAIFADATGRVTHTTSYAAHVVLAAQYGLFGASVDIVQAALRSLGQSGAEVLLGAGNQKVSERDAVAALAARDGGSVFAVADSSELPPKSHDQGEGWRIKDGKVSAA